MPLSLIVDPAQQRLQSGLISLSAIGDQWDGATLTNVFVDPITKTVMRQPHQMEDSFWTSNSGNYAKLTTSAFNFAPTSSNWENRSDQYAVGPCICGKDASLSGEYAISTGTYTKNRGWCISWFAYGTGSQFEQFTCGWRTDAVASDSAGVSLKFHASGDVEVWKAGVLVNTGKISGAKGASTTEGKWVTVYVMPHRGRELLIFSNLGDGFTTPFDDLEQNWDPESNQEIIPAGYFWWGLSNGAASVMLAPLTFPTTGNLVSAPGEFVSDYNAHGGDLIGDVVAETYEYTGWKPTALADAIRVTAYDIEATTDPSQGRKGHIKIEWTDGDQYQTAQVFGAVVGKYPTTAMTDASEETDIAAYFLGATVEVPDEPSGVRISATVKDSPGLEAIIPQWRSMTSRPIQLKDTDTGIVWIDGIIDEISWVDSPNDELIFTDLQIRDRWRQLEKQVIRSEYPLDRLELSAAIKKLLRLAGADDLDQGNIEATAYYLPSDTSPDGNQWALLVRQGDNLADWLKRIIGDYAAPYFYGIVPGQGFVFRSPATIDAQTPDAILYRDSDAAIAGGVAAGDVWKSGYWSLKVQTIEPEANEIWVTGWDRRTGRAIQAFYRDDDLQDATLPPSSRLPGWAGEPRLYGLVDSALGNEDDVDRTCAFLAEVLKAVREGYEATANVVLRMDSYPAWRGDKFTLKDVNGEDKEVIIAGFSFDVRFEAEPPVRTARYTAVSKMGRPTFGRTLGEMSTEIRERGRNNVVVRRDSEFLRSLPAKRSAVIV